MFFQLQNLNRLTFSRLPECCINCGWWQGFDESWPPGEADGWNRLAENSFGRWGKLASGDGALLGMVQYAPAHLFSRRYSCGPVGRDSILLTCSLIADPTLDSVRKSLVLAAIAELREQEYQNIEAFCHQVPGTRGRGHLFEQQFLRDCGFYPVRSKGGMQLMRLELGGVQPAKLSSGKSRRGILERLRRPTPAPVPLAPCECEPAFDCDRSLAPAPAVAGACR